MSVFPSCRLCKEPLFLFPLFLGSVPHPLPGLSQVLALHISVAETRSIIGVVCLAVQIYIPVILKDLDHLIPDIHVVYTAAIDSDDGFGMKFVRIPERSFFHKYQLSLPIHTPPLGLAVKYQLHGRPFTTFRLKGNGLLADAHAEEIWVIGIMEYLMLFRSLILRLFGFSTFLHVNCFLIEKKLLYPNVKDSIIILPWIDPISDHNDFSK